MTIAYLIDYLPGDASGVMQKVTQQSSIWSKHGHKVYFISFKNMTIYDENWDVLYREKFLDIKSSRFATALRLFYSAYNLKKLLKNIEFDILYMRYQLYMPFLRGALKQSKVIMEINSDDTLEYKLNSKLTDLYNRYSRNLILKEVNAFVCVSEELKEKFVYLNKPAVVIANGIATKEYIMAEETTNSKPVIVFIGSPGQDWHGLDKIVKMAKTFKHWQFKVIGTSGKDLDNLHYLGYLSHQKSSEIIAQSDIGIGTLSLYKTGLQEASPLKTRQYLACGLPIIYAYKDTDLPEKSDFALRLKNCKDNIDRQIIREFVEKVFGKKEIRLMAREFADNVLDYNNKEKLRLSFFQKVLENG